MIRIEYDAELLGDSADSTRPLVVESVTGDGADEIVQGARADYVMAFERGNRSASISFRVVQLYGTPGEAAIAIVQREGQLPRQATLDYIVEYAGETTTHRMRDALRASVKGTPRGVTVEWEFNFTGARWVEVATPAAAIDYDGGEADSGDVWTEEIHGGESGDGCGAAVPWFRTLDGGEAA